MKTVHICALVLITLVSLSAEAESWLRPDTQEPRCLEKNDEKLAACLQTCDAKPATIASLCRKQCLDSQEAAKKNCDKKLKWELPGV